MSEPFSLVVFAPADPQRLQAALRAEVKPVSTFTDWDALDIALTPADFARADAITPASVKRYLQDLRQSAVQDRGWRFMLDPQTGYLTITCLFWTASWPEIVSGINALRQLLMAISDGRQGYILAHDFIFNTAGTATAIQFQKGASRVTGAGDTGNITTLEHANQLVKPILKAASAVFDGTLAAESPEAQLVDQFEQWAGG